VVGTKFSLDKHVKTNNFVIKMSGNTSIGHNILTNKFHCLNGKIPLNWLNKSMEAFKIACKNKFLTFN
jgi:hypothetical protein